jgi:hypothetical protein
MKNVIISRENGDLNFIIIRPNIQFLNWKVFWVPFPSHTQRWPWSGRCCAHHPCTHTHTHLCQRVTHVSIFQCFANRHLFLRLWNNFFFLLLPSPDKKFRWENKTPKRNNKIISLNLPWDDRNILWRRCRTGRWSCTLCICTTSGPWPMSTSWR